MDIKNFYLDIVTLKKEIFSGLVRNIQITGDKGELSIFYKHSPLLTIIKPGWIRITRRYKKEYIYISGGVLEVQPNNVIVLADTAIIGKDIDQIRALNSKKNAETQIKTSNYGANYVIAHAKLSKAIAKLKVIEKIKNLLNN